MRKLLFIAVLFGLLFGQSIDADKSFVKFTVRNMGIRDVVGTITDMKGTVKFDSSNLDSSYFDVMVNVNTINTNNDKRDKHLRNEDFFETETWPNIHFKSKMISRQDNLLGVAGTLTIKDVAKEVFVPFVIEESDSTIIFTGGRTISRLEYNVGVDTDTFKIGDEINVEVTCVTIKNEK